MQFCIRSAAVAMFFVLLAAQQALSAAFPAPQQKPDARQQPTKVKPLRAMTRLVELSVVVNDNHDQPLADLKKGDFTVFDDGKPQDIRIFSVATNQPLSHPPAPLPRDTYSSRVPGTGDAPANITVILLDTLNTPFADQAFANQRVVKFLQQLQPQDRIALYTLGSRLRVLHDFTSDASSLLAAMKNYKGQLSDLDFPAVPDMGNRASLGYRFTKDEEQYEVETLLAKRIRRTLDAIMTIANHVGPLPGRKNLVWISGSFPFVTKFVQLTAPLHERVIFAQEVQGATEAITNEAMVIYPVDARGLMPPDVEHNFAPPDAFDFMTMKVLAAETGGRAFFNTNDIGGAIRSAIDDSRVTYELGFYPNLAKWDGSFHRLKVKVNRPGVHVRTRKGYFALPEPPATPEAQQARNWQAAARLLQSHEIDLTVRVDAPASTQDSRTLSLNVMMDPRQLSLKQQNGRWSGIVDLLFVQLDDQYRIVHSLKQPYQLSLLASTYERSPAEGFTLTQVVQVLPKASQLRVILQDDSTGLAGAVGVPLSTYFPVPSSTTN